MLDVRPMQPADLPAMLGLWVAAWQATMPDIDFAARRDWFAERLEGFSRTGVLILCAVDAAAVLGFITIDGRTQYLDQLAVAPAAFGQGVAVKLLEAAKQASPRGIELLVNQDNPRAVRFYEREGFVCLGPAAGATTGRPVWRMSWGARARADSPHGRPMRRRPASG